MKFEQWVRKLVGIALIIGPLLLVIYALFDMADELAPAGVFGFYGGILLLVSALWLSWQIGQQSPRLGITCLITGLLGGIILVMAPVDRLTGEMLLREGVSETAIDAVIEDVPWQLMLVWINGLLFPLSWMLIGYGLQRVAAVPRWQSAVLIAGGFSFFIGQGIGIATGAAQVGSMVLLLVGLAPIGWRMVSVGTLAPDIQEPSLTSS